ncbi:hypothetical protein HDU96_003610 [Phlyctochytrium bullatum]|nr:hypothetical protein HDU96_003610 [Phlyctochytrium bullatum]
MPHENQHEDGEILEDLEDGEVISFETEHDNNKQDMKDEVKMRCDTVPPQMQETPRTGGGCFAGAEYASTAPFAPGPANPRKIQELKGSSSVSPPNQAQQKSAKNDYGMTCREYGDTFIVYYSLYTMKQLKEKKNLRLIVEDTGIALSPIWQTHFLQSFL